MLCSRNATAKVATSIDRGRLRPQRPEDDASIASDRAITTAKQSTIPAQTGQSHSEAKRERVGAGHDQLAVGEVDEPQDAEDEADPDRHQRVDRAQADRVDEHLQSTPETVQRSEALTRGTPPPSPSVSSASAGVRVKPQLSVRDHVASGRRARRCAAPAARRAGR